MTLVGDQRGPLTDEYDVYLIERLIERAAVNFQNIVGDESVCFHERNDIVEQRRAFIDLETCDFEQNSLQVRQNPRRTLENLQFIALCIDFQEGRQFNVL